MFCCLRMCLNGEHRKSPSTVNRLREPEIHLDPKHQAAEVILLSHQLRITGAGGALLTAPLVQSKSYFEIKIQHKGLWSVGLATAQTDLSSKHGGMDKDSWCLCSDNVTRHNNEEVGPVVVNQNQPLGKTVLLNGTNAADSGLISVEDINEDLLLTTGSSKPEQINVNSEHSFPNEGDIVGVSFDHIELNFYFNGKNLEVPYRNVRGTVFPVLYVGDGAILDIILDNFNYTAPSGFDKIMLEQSLL